MTRLASIVAVATDQQPSFHPVFFAAVTVALAVAVMGAAVRPVISIFGELLRSLMHAVIAMLVAAAALALLALAVLR